MAKVDTSQWVVALFPKNKEKSFYSVRLFKTVDHAGAHYGKSSRTRLLYVSAGEMEHRLTPAKLQEYLRDITVQFSDETEQYRSSAIRKDRALTLVEDSSDELVRLGNREALAKGLWTICHLIGDQVFGLPDSPENEDKFKICLDKLTENDGAIWAKLAKQAKVLCQALIDLNEPVATEEELHQMVKHLVKSAKLKTKQDPVLIWKYYASYLGDLGLIYYPSKRHKREDHAEQMSGI